MSVQISALSSLLAIPPDRQGGVEKIGVDVFFAYIYPKDAPIVTRCQKTYNFFQSAIMRLIYFGSPLLLQILRALAVDFWNLKKYLVYIERVITI